MICLVAFWRWMCKKNILREWPTVKKFPEPERIPVAWTVRDLEKLWASCRRLRGKIAGIPAADWWVSLHTFLWYSGERIGAAMAAKWAGYDGRPLVISGEDRKAGKGMVYLLRAEVVEAIKSIRDPARKLIWPWDFNPTLFYYRYKQIVLKAGLPYTPWKSGPHNTRRSFARYLEQAGGDATNAFKHTNAALAAKSYIDPRIARVPLLARPAVCCWVTPARCPEYNESIPAQLPRSSIHP